jgi:hypothetical protein
VSIVLNEWIIHDLSGQNGLAPQRESGRFLESLHKSAETIVVLRDSRWIIKAFGLMKVATPSVRILSQFLHLAILIDPLKCRYIEPEEIQSLPEDLSQEVPEDDFYLFQTALAGHAEIIVTSDLRLIDRVRSAAGRGIQLVERGDYLDRYR